MSLADVGLDNGHVTFGIVARLSPEKNINYAIDLISSMHNANLIIVGDGPERAKIESRISDDSSIKLVGHKRNIEDYYNLFDAFLLTSKYEGMPISILEAMSVGKPIIATESPFEIFKDKSLKIFFSEKDFDIF